MLDLSNKREEEIKVNAIFKCGEDVWAMFKLFVMVFVEAHGDGVIIDAGEEATTVSTCGK